MMRLELNIGSARASIIITFTLDEARAEYWLSSSLYYYYFHIRYISRLSTGWCKAKIMECSLMVFSLPEKITQNYLFLVFPKACLEQSEARRLWSRTKGVKCSSFTPLVVRKSQHWLVSSNEHGFQPLVCSLLEESALKWLTTSNNNDVLIGIIKFNNVLFLIY